MFNCGQTLLEAVLATNPWELLAVVAAIAYLLLAMRQHIACWCFALLSTIIYTVLYWDVSLYMESLLNAYYIAMAIYGWWAWRQKKPNNSGNIISWGFKQHLTALLCIVSISYISGYGLANNTDAQHPYLDSFTTWAAVLTTYMVAKKILENWLYWIVINGIGIYLNIDRCLLLTSVLLMSYQVIAIFGYISWRKEWNGYNANNNAKASTG